jgi:hypothetical protein
MRTYRQDSDDTKPYVIDWSDQLEEDVIGTSVADVTISSSVWTVSGMTSANETISNALVRTELSGGSVGTSYKVENKITTSQGLVHTKSFYVLVVNK